MADTAALDGLIKAIERNTAADKESIDALKDLFDPGSGRFRAKRAQEKKEYKAVEDQVDILRESSSNMVGLNDSIAKAQAYRALDMKVSKKQRKQVLADAKQAMKTSATMDDVQKRRIKRVMKEISLNRNLETNLHLLSAEVAGVAKVESELLKKKVDESANQSLFHTKMSELGKGAKKLTSNFFKLSTASGLLVAGTMKTFDVIEEASKTQAPVISAMTGNITDFVETYGVSQQEFLTVFDENTRAIMGASGTMTSLTDAGKGFLNSYSNMSSELRELTGSSKEAMTLAAESMTLLSASGVQMSFEEMEEQITGPKGLASSLRFLARASKTSGREVTQMVGRMEEDTGMRYELIGLGEKEQKNRKAQLLLDTKQLVSTGLSIEKAMEFQKTLTSLTQTQDPKAFMKTMGKTVAIAGAAGLDPKLTQQYQKEMMTGKPNKEFMQLFATELDKAISKKTGATGADKFGTRALGMQLRSILPPETAKMINEGSSAAVEHRKIAAEQQKVIETQAAQTNEGILGIFDWTKGYWEKFSSILKSPEASLIGGVGTAIGSVIKFAAEIGFASIGMKALGISFSSLLAPIASVGTAIGGFISNIAAMGAAGFVAAAGAVAAIGAAIGYGIGTLFNTLMEKFFPELFIEMQDAIGGTIEQIGINVNQLWNDITDSLPDLSSWFNDDDQSAQDAERNKIEVNNALKLQEGLKEVALAISEGNADRIAAAKQNVAAITDQTLVQKETAEKAMDQTKTQNGFNNMAYQP